MTLTEEQVLALAPDESSRKAGLGLAGAAKWLSRGAGAAALWGECQGSGSKPYQTAVDLGSIAFKCSCPSRKFPCKHGLGLMLSYVRNGTDFTTSDAPAWVADWLEKRSTAEEKQSAKPDKPVDAAAQAKRAQAREQKVLDGIEELQRWMKDLLRNGLVRVPEQHNSYFENMARRLVDAQAGALAGMVRQLGEVGTYRDGWQTEFLDRLAAIHLVAGGFEQRAALPEPLLRDVRSAIGFPTSAETLSELPGVQDAWLVLAKQVSEEENGLTTERYWLCGAATGGMALVLQFIVRGAPPQLLLMPGQVFDGELVYYPSALPLRAAVRQQGATDAAFSASSFLDGWDAVAAAEAAANAVLPFRGPRPYLLQGLRPIPEGSRWLLQDAAGAVVELTPGYANTMHLLALGGGDFLPMAVLGADDTFEPLGIWHNGLYKIC